MLTRRTANTALRHPLLFLGLAFLLEMCASQANQGAPGSESTTTESTTTESTGTLATPDGGVCSTDGDCALPPSRCSQSGASLIYYTHPSCAQRTCSWTQEELACPCANGGCVGTGTSGGVGSNTAGPSLTTAGTGFSGSSGAQSGAAGLGDFDANDDADTRIDDRDVGSPDVDGARPSCNGANDCALPPSYCKDASTLVYAQRVMCVDHVCEASLSELQCRCSGNGCAGTTTR